MLPTYVLQYYQFNDITLTALSREPDGMVNLKITERVFSQEGDNSSMHLKGCKYP